MKKILLIILLLPCVAHADQGYPFVRAFIQNTSTAGANVATPFFMACVSTSGVQESCSGSGSSGEPLFLASPAYGITASSITNWNTAYGWGDHPIKSTAAIVASINSLIASTGTINTSLDAVILSTGTIQISLNAVILSTGTISGGDNLGNHLATTTLTVGYGTLGTTANYSSSITANAFYGNGATLTGVVTQDTLGTHLATTTLHMGAFGVNTSSAVTAAFYQVAGSTVLAILTGTYYNTAVGVGAGIPITTGYTTTVGYGAGNALVGRGYSTLIGTNAGNTLNSVGTAAANTTIIGSGAGTTQQSGINNIFIGSGAGPTVGGGHTASYNNFIGNGAGHSATTGGYNVGVGDSVFGVLTTGGGNVGGGYNAGYGITTGGNNTMEGFNSGYSITTGSSNIAIGYKSGYTITTGTGNIIIGSGLADAPTAGTSNYLFIGNTPESAIYGDMLATSTITFSGSISVQSIVDRTPYPKDTAEAWRAIQSIQAKPEGGVDHGKLDPFVKGGYVQQKLVRIDSRNEAYIDEDGKDKIRVTPTPIYSYEQKTGRDLSATVSALVESVKDLEKRVKLLEAR